MPKCEDHHARKETCMQVLRDDRFPNSEALWAGEPAAILSHGSQATGDLGGQNTILCSSLGCHLCEVCPCDTGELPIR